MRFFSQHLVFCWILVLLNCEAKAQQTTRSVANASLDPCPGGVGIMEFHSELAPNSLDLLISMTDLIVVGTVSNVPPAVLSMPNRVNYTQTDSEVVIRQLLFGTLPPGINSILVSQMGGTVGSCTIVVPADPLVKFNEDYILFLRVDKKEYPPKALSLPRYAAVGVWSGKAKILNGQVEFPPAANAKLREYDKTNVNSFVALVQQRISVLFPKKQPGRGGQD